MPKITSECIICHKKNVTEVKCFNLGSSKFITLDCGHTYKSQVSLTKSDNIRLLDGKELYPFQVLGVHFAEQSGFNCLIADDTGLGKTIQAIGLLHLHLDELKPVLIVVKSSLTLQWQRHILAELEKFAQIVGSKTDLIPTPIYITSFDMVGKIDWSKVKIKTIILDECQMIKNHDAKRTNGIRKLINKENEIQSRVITESEKSARVKRSLIIAQDLMKYHGLENRFIVQVHANMGKKLGLCKCKVFGEGIIKGEIILSKNHLEKDSENDIIETILHEIAHAITPGAGHIPIWKETAKSIGSNGETYASFCTGSIDPDLISKEKEVKYKIFLSGTPVKNNAVEYWPSLNLLRPELFPSRDRFIKWEVGYYQNSKGVWKPGGIKSPKEFQEKTKDFIIRRLKKEVLPELPEMTRDFRYHEINPDETAAYGKGIKRLEDFLRNTSSSDKSYSMDLQSHIMILRHIVGLGKINPIMEFVDEFLEENADNDRKLAIFHHHIDVGEVLEGKLKERDQQYFRLVSTMDVSQRDAGIAKFRDNPEVRFFVAPSLAAGEGYDLEFADIGILLEREWNPANELQVEGRFIRATPESIAKAKAGLLKATMVYPTAVNTIDEYFAELVERKRQFVSETLDGKADTTWDQTEIMTQLAHIAVSRWNKR